MKKNILIILCIFFNYTFTHAEIIDIDIAKNDALNLFNQNNKLKSLNNSILIEEVSFNEHLELLDSVPAFYIFNSSDNQFAIISADDRTPRVLGYCDKNKFNPSDIPPQLKWLLNQYYKQIKSIPTTAKATSYHPLSTSTTILLKTANYNQHKPYNNRCPQNSLTGCVATAMAIVMKYHQWPNTGVGSHSYKYKNTVLSKDYSNITFAWKSMLDSYDNESYNYYQANAIAELMYSCGVAVEMDYGTDVSSAFTDLTATALLKHFKYDDHIERVHASIFSKEQWIKMIRTEIENGRPILYSGAGNGSGHAFVCDGISAWDVPHINWGWGGNYNGYYLLNDFTPGENHDYSSNHFMVIGIQPEYETINRSLLHMSAKDRSNFWGLVPSTDSIVTNIPFECTITGLDNYDYTNFSGSIGLMLISENKGKQLLCSKRLNTPTFSPIQFKNIIVTSEIDSTDIIQLVSLKDEETTWLPIVSSHSSKSYFKVRGDSFDTIPITWDIPAGVTVDVIDGPSLNYAHKGSSYRFKLKVPEGSSHIQCFINDQFYSNSNEYVYNISFTHKDSYHIRVSGNIGVEPTINSSFNMTVLNNSIYLKNLSANSNIRVFNINGQLIHSSISDGEYIIQLPTKGFYILKINNKSFKISNI